MRLGFVNYVRDPTRETPINSAAARFILGGYLIWKTVWMDWHEVLEVPFVFVEEYAAFIPDSATLLVVEKYVLVLFLLAFILGYRLRLSAFVSAFLVGHLGAIRLAFNTSGSVTALFIAMYFLIFFGLYSHVDELSFDVIRRTRNESLPDLVSRLKSPTRSTYRMDGHRWSLLTIAIIYFGSGFDKLSQSGLAWIDPENLRRILVERVVLYDSALSVGSTEVAIPLGAWLMEHSALVWASSVSTLVLEIGFLPAAILGVSVTPFVLGLYGMTTIIWLAMGIFFADVYLFLGMFFAWDRLHERLTRDRDLDLVFDERCYFCARSLYPFKLLDTNGTVTFYSQSDVPAHYSDRNEVDLERAMYVFDGDQGHEGYYAFRELLNQFGILVPIVLLMRLPPVEQIGSRVYTYIADNRSRHFVCSVDTDGL